MEPRWVELELELAELLPRLAPCQQTEVRLVPTVTVPRFKGQQFCDGFTQVNADRIARSFMTDPPPSRFVALMYDRARVEAWGVTDPKVFRRHVIALGIHEYAHAIEMDFVAEHRRPAPEGHVEIDTARIAAQGARDYTNLSQAEYRALSRMIALMHDGRFVRVALHLRHRAMILGTDLARLTPGAVVSTARGRRHADFYAAALADEPERLVNRPFVDILALEPPAAFAELWERDRKDLEINCR